MHIDLVTLFPEVTQALHYGVTGQALKKNLLKLYCWNPRDYTTDKHACVDDRPYGGGPGMVMTIQPLRDAIAAAKAAAPVTPPPPVIFLSPRGTLLNQTTIKTLAKLPQLILVAGRYEGIDERLIDLAIDETYSIGNYVLSGGEIASLVVVDCLARLLPGTLGSVESAQQDSFENGLLDCPHYTRPAIYVDESSNTVHQVPKVLLSGDHAAIARWRLQQSLGQTWLKRPDLLEARKLNDQEQALLDAFIQHDTEVKNHE